MRALIVFLSFCFTLQSFSQSKSFEKGKIIDSISIDGAQETYALYLPTSFNAEKPSSVVLIFDPAARGKLGIEVFKEASEIYGHILVCSNNTKNGIHYETNFEITNRLTQAVFNTFKINEQQIYTAGFSGGSRLASAIAALTNKITGVIACGAGLSVNKSFKPSEGMFSYVGLVGDEDINYLEMLNARTLLNNNKIDNELIIYNDIHRWPAKEHILRAFGWLELQAYKKRIKIKDDDLINKLYKSQYIIADSLAENDVLFRAIIEFESISKNFGGYYNLDSITAKINTIKVSKHYKSVLVNEKRLVDKENAIFERFSKVYGEEIKQAKSPDNFRWWREEIKLLDDAIENSKDFEEVKMYKRVRYSLHAGAIESSNAFIRNGKGNHALYCDKLLTLYNTEKPYWYFRLAQSYARIDDYSSTIRQLKKAIKLGFNRKNYIENAIEFKNYKDKKEFVKLLSSL
jgi:hypothetical protein